MSYMTGRCYECGDVKRLNRSGVCHWRAGCEHRQMAAAAQTRRLVEEAERTVAAEDDALWRGQLVSKLLGRMRAGLAVEDVGYTFDHLGGLIGSLDDTFAPPRPTRSQFAEMFFRPFIIGDDWRQPGHGL